MTEVCTVQQQELISRIRMHWLTITKASSTGRIVSYVEARSTRHVRSCLYISENDDCWAQRKILRRRNFCHCHAMTFEDHSCRYNLKRKVANMPPVTREWFEARKETLAASTGAPVSKIWIDPLTNKKFGSENTHKAFVNSKKYKDLVKASGQPAPQPAVSLRRATPAGIFPRLLHIFERCTAI